MYKKEMIRNFYQNIVSNNLVNEMDKYVSADCTIRSGEQNIRVGLKGMKEHLAAIRTIYPDLKIRITRQHADNEFVISETITEGTHLGEWCGIKPSGKKLVFTGVNIDRVVDNKIVENGELTNLFDTFWEEKIIKAS